jgi:gliding motility-associated transport system permease protein/gliding motility-associatede transport system auxiliary component
LSSREPDVACRRKAIALGVKRRANKAIPDSGRHDGGRVHLVFRRQAVAHGQGCAGAEGARDDAAEAAKAAAATADKDGKASITGVIGRSPESSRLILIGSGTFLSDDVLQLASSVDRTQYLAPVDFAQSLVDWSLEDRGLLALRSRGGQFSRTLAPMGGGGQVFWEYLNYALALVGLGVVYIVRRQLRLGTRRKYLNMFGIEGARI